MRPRFRDTFGIDSYLTKTLTLNFAKLEKCAKRRFNHDARGRIQAIARGLYAEAVLSVKTSKGAKKQLVELQRVSEEIASKCKALITSFGRVSPALQLRLLALDEKGLSVDRFTEPLSELGTPELGTENQEKIFAWISYRQFWGAARPLYAEHQSVKRLFDRFLEENTKNSIAYLALAKRAKQEITEVDRQQHYSGRGRKPSSQYLLRQAIYWLHAEFRWAGPNAKVTYDDGSESMKGLFLEFVWEIVQQLKPYIHDATADLFPSGVFLHVLRPTLEERRIEMNALGKAIKEALPKSGNSLQQ